MTAKLHPFDIAGIVAIGIFAAVLSSELGALRWSREEMPITVSSEELAAGFREGVAWHGFYLRGAKVGFSRQEQYREDDGYRIRSWALFDLHVMRTARRLQLELEARLDADLVLQTFAVQIDSDFSELSARGEVLGDCIDLVVTSGGVEQRTSLPVEAPPSFSFTLRPALMRQGLADGQRFEHQFFDPFSLTTRTMTIEYAGTEKIVVMGDEVTAHLLHHEVGGQIFDAWVNDLGDVLREELALGVTAVRQSEADATYGLGRGASIPTEDLVEAAAVPVTLPPGLVSQQQVRYQLSGARLDGLDLDGGRQHFSHGGEEAVTEGTLVLSRESNVAILAMDQLGQVPEALHPYLAAEPLLQVDDEEIRATARRCTAGADTVRAAARSTVSWVFDRIRKTTVVGVPSAAQVLRSGAGDCNEHAILTVALLRAAGIPARVASGLAYLDDYFYYHAWIEYWDGRWVSADPTWDQHPADLTHLRIVVGGLSRQLEILRLMGNLVLSCEQAGDSPGD